MHTYADLWSYEVLHKIRPKMLKHLKNLNKLSVIEGHLMHNLPREHLNESVSLLAS